MCYVFAPGICKAPTLPALSPPGPKARKEEKKKNMIKNTQRTKQHTKRATDK